MKGVFITGTDTGVGKTLAACAWIHAARAAGMQPGAMKPIAAGAEPHDGALLNEDTAAMLAALGWPAARAGEVTPIVLREPIAPHIAASLESRAIDLDALHAAFARMAAAHEYVVVEGVGGFLVPLDGRQHTGHLARRMALPVVMVVGMRLGCLNHALLTAQAVEREGLELAGWIASCITPAMPYRDENIDTLKRWLHAPHLGTIPYMETPDAAQAAVHLRIPRP